MQHEKSGSTQLAKDAFQLFQISEFDGDAARSFLVATYDNSRTNRIRELFLQAQKITVNGWKRGFLWRTDDLLHQPLGVPDREVFVHDTLSQCQLLFGCKRQECPGMAHVKLAVEQ